jgi:hypothetical protein
LFHHRCLFPCDDYLSSWTHYCQNFHDQSSFSFLSDLMSSSIHQKSYYLRFSPEIFGKQYKWSIPYCIQKNYEIPTRTAYENTIPGKQAGGLLSVRDIR